MSRAAIKTGVLAGVDVGVNALCGASEFTISGISANMIDANEFGYAANNKVPDGTYDCGTISIPNVFKDISNLAQIDLEANIVSGAGYGPDEIKFRRDATSYYTAGTGGKIYVTKIGGGGMKRNGLEPTSYESQISGALLVLRPALVSIAVTPGTPSKAIGATQQFVATGTYSSGPTVDITAFVTWASATPAKIIITAGGLAVGLATGTSVISATMLGISGNTTMTAT